MKYIKLFWYAKICDYHIKKSKKIGFSHYPAAANYHYEMAKYYYEKSFGKKFIEK